MLFFLSVEGESSVEVVVVVSPGVMIKDARPFAIFVLKVLSLARPFAIFVLKVLSLGSSSKSSQLASSLVNARMLFKVSSFEKHKKRGHVPSVDTIPFRM